MDRCQVKCSHYSFHLFINPCSYVQKCQLHCKWNVVVYTIYIESLMYIFLCANVKYEYLFYCITVTHSFSWYVPADCNVPDQASQGAFPTHPALGHRSPIHCFFHKFIWMETDFPAVFPAGGKFEFKNSIQTKQYFISLGKLIMWTKSSLNIMMAL